MHWHYWMGLFCGLLVGIFIGRIWMQRILVKKIILARSDILAKMNDGIVSCKEFLKKMGLE